MNDALGFIRVNLPRYTLLGQINAMEVHSVSDVIRKGGKLKPGEAPDGMNIQEGDANDVLRMARAGTVIAVQHAHLLADPSKRSVRGGTRRDFRRVWDALHEKGAVIWELYTDRRSDRKNEREAMALDAVEALALGRHKVRHTDKRGRPAQKFSDAEHRQAFDAWHSRKLQTWAAVRAKMPKGFSISRAYKLWGARNTENG